MEQPTTQGITARLFATGNQRQDRFTAPIPLLFIIDQLCELGGAEKVLLRMVDGLPRERYAPHVITFKIDRTLGIEQTISCPLYVYPLCRTYDWKALTVARHIRRIVCQKRVRITHTFHETADLWAGPIARTSGCPILISSRRDMGFNRLPKHRPAYRWMGRMFNQVQTVSEQVRRRNIEEDGLDPARVVTVYNGVDLPTPTEYVDRVALRQQLGIDPKDHVVTSVGHIRPIKGFDVMIRAAAQVRQQMSNVTFVVAGEEYDRAHAEHLKHMARQYGLAANFRFLGCVQEVRNLLHASDLFCLLSRTEGLSNALLEAMACGLPCIATSVGGNPEVVVEGKTGFLTPSEDADSAAASILRLLQNPDLARSMGEDARKVVEQKFTTEAMIRTLTNSYEYLLSTHPH